MAKNSCFYTIKKIAENFCPRYDDWINAACSTENTHDLYSDLSSINNIKGLGKLGGFCNDGSCDDDLICVNGICLKSRPLTPTPTNTPTITPSSSYSFETGSGPSISSTPVSTLTPTPSLFISDTTPTPTPTTFVRNIIIVGDIWGYSSTNISYDAVGRIKVYTTPANVTLKLKWYTRKYVRGRISETYEPGTRLILPRVNPPTDKYDIEVLGGSTQPARVTEWSLLGETSLFINEGTVNVGGAISISPTFRVFTGAEFGTFAGSQMYVSLEADGAKSINSGRSIIFGRLFV